MTDEKSVRAKAIDETDLTIERKVCHAACDYKYAKQNSVFANEHGGIDVLRNDLFLFVDEWVEGL